MGPVSRPAPPPAPSPRGFGRGTSSVSARRHRVVWSGTARSSPSRPMTEPISPSVCRYASRNTALNVSAVRIARSEYSGCPPRLVRRSASHASTASSENQTVKLPRRRRLSSYSRQFVTLRFCSGMWWRRSWFSLKGKADIPGQTEGCPATSIGPRVPPVGSLQQRDFLRALIAAVPYRLHTVLTDNGTHFTTPGNPAAAAPLIKEAIARGELFRAHAFELACAQNDIEHRLTKPYHPWTNGQVERMNRTLKDATVRRYHYDSHDQLWRHLADFVMAYNFARRLKTLKGLTPYEFICKQWTREPERFRLDPLHQMPGLNSYSPELQPAEHLWPVLDEPLVNRYFETLADLEHVVTERCRVLNRDQLKPGTNFHWWPKPAIPA